MLFVIMAREFFAEFWNDSLTVLMERAGLSVMSPWKWKQHFSPYRRWLRVELYGIKTLDTAVLGEIYPPYYIYIYI